MKRYSTIMSILIALALPAAGMCADATSAPSAPAAKAEVKGDTKAEIKGETKTDVKAEPKADTQAEGTTDAKPMDGKSKADAKAKAKEDVKAKADAKAKARAERAEAIKDSMSKTKHGAMIGGSVPTGDSGKLNPSGKVVQTLNGGGYTYANIEKDGKNTWVAYSALETQVGDVLSFNGCVEMTKFESKALNRTFDSILFCGPPEVKSGAKKAAKKSPGSGGASASAGKVKVEKAAGANAYTIAEIFAKRNTLSGKQVVVKGQVVKVSTGIMNRNWLHLQDGTGSEKQKTHDLVVTSSELANVGDVVTVSGTVAKDKDFGGGYKYVVIIEKGSVKK